MRQLEFGRHVAVRARCLPQHGAATVAGAPTTIAIAISHTINTANAESRRVSLSRDNDPIAPPLSAHSPAHDAGTRHQRIHNRDDSMIARRRKGEVRKSP